MFSNAEFCAESDSGGIFDIRGCTVGQNSKKPNFSLFFSKLITDSPPKSLIDLLQTPCACCHIVWEELTSILRPYLNYYGNEKLRRCQKNARFYLCFLHVQKRFVIGAISGQKWIEKLQRIFSGPLKTFQDSSEHCRTSQDLRTIHENSQIPQNVCQGLSEPLQDLSKTPQDLSGPFRTPQDLSGDLRASQEI